MDNLHVTLSDRPKLTVKIEKEYIKPLLQDLTVTPAGDVQVFTPVAPYNGFETVTVGTIQTEKLTATENGTYTPSEGKYFDEITVDVESEEAFYTPTGTIYVRDIVFPDTVNNANINSTQYLNATELRSVVLKNVNTILSQGFRNCTKLETVQLNDGIETIGSYAFSGDVNLKTINIPASVTTTYAASTASGSFSYCRSLENVTLGQGFSASLNLSASNKFSVDTIVAMFNALADLTGDTAKTLTLGAANLAKVTEEQKQIATNKNWNLA